MKENSKIILIVGLLLAVVISLPFASAASAESSQLTQSQLDQISGGCAISKTTLSQLHSSDTLMRINRGQIYESLTSKLMGQFNARLTVNGARSNSLNLATDNYNNALNEFRNSYITYEEQLTKAINTSCQKPTDFYDAIVSARELRFKVHDNVLKLNQLIDSYRQALGDFAINYSSSKESN